MVQDTAQRWNRTEGVLIAPGTQPDAVADRLVADRVVARLEWYPSSPHLLSVTLMADADGRVAVTPPAPTAGWANPIPPASSRWPTSSAA